MTEVLRPAHVGRKGVGVQQAGRIHPTARIAVLPPGAARLGVFFENRERRQAEFFESEAGQDAGHPGADNHHLEVGRRRERRNLRLRAEPHLFARHGAVLGGDRHAGGQVHGCLQDLVARRSDRFVARQIGRQQLGRLALNLGSVAQVGNGLRIVGQVGHDCRQGAPVGLLKQGRNINIGGGRHGGNLQEPDRLVQKVAGPTPRAYQAG